MVNKISTVFEFDQKGNGLKKVQADLKQTEGGLNKVKTASKGAWAELKSNKVAQGALFGAAITGAKMAVDAASDLEESINAVKVTYGEAAEGVLAIGENSAKSFGLATADFNALSVQFSSFAETVAGDGGDVVGVLDDLVGRSADFASVMNIDVADAARIFQSGLAGETEPLKKFGINLSAAAVNAYALESGLVDSTSEMDDAMKVTARYQLLMQETADTQGDFANTSDSLANQQRILQASMTNLAADVGGVLIPELSKLVANLQDVTDAAVTVGGAIADVVGPMDEAADSIPGWDSLKRSLEESINPWERITGAADAFKEVFGETTDEIDLQRGAFREHGRAIDVSADGIAKYRAEQGEAQRFTEEFAGAIGSLDSELAMIRSNGPQAAAALAGIGDEAEDAVSHVDAITEAFETLSDSLSDRKDFLNLEDAFDDVARSAQEAWDAAAEGGMDADRAVRDHERAIIDLKQEVIDYAAEVESVPEEAVTEIQALIDRGLFNEAEAALASLERTRQVRLNVTTNYSVDPLRRVGDRYYEATGGIVTKPTMAMIGEAGPEAVVPLNQAPGASPLPNMGGKATSSSNISLVVNAGIGTDGAAVGRMIVDEIRHYERSNGPGWRAA